MMILDVADIDVRNIHCKHSKCDCSQRISFFITTFIVDGMDIYIWNDVSNPARWVSPLTMVISILMLTLIMAEADVGIIVSKPQKCNRLCWVYISDKKSHHGGRGGQEHRSIFKRYVCLSILLEIHLFYCDLYPSFRQ